MIEYDFIICGDAEDWTEQEKEWVRRRHEMSKEAFNKQWAGIVWETIGKYTAVKTGKEDD